MTGGDRHIAALAVVLSFLGAFLLFLLQPMLGKVLLPWFGGTPMVWAACMLTFQALLLLGYWYAHRVTRRLAQHQAALHVALLVMSLFTLPVLPALDAPPPPGRDPLLAVVVLIAANAALPFVLLATTSPLLQRWYVDTYPERPPWWLYALSNAGSLLALLVYPLLVEPWFDLNDQSLLWSACYGVYCAGFAYTAWRYRSGDCQSSGAEHTDPISWPRRGRWLVLAAAASAMLLVTTNELSQDVAIVPFLWVTPLALFLVTFILAFESDRWYRRYPVALLCLLAIALLLVSDSRAILDFYIRVRWQLPMSRDLWIYTGLHLFVLFLVCLLCHGELARSRPPAQQLTGFYLTVAAGGVLGSVVIAVLMPLILDSYLELRWALLLAAFGAALLLFRSLQWNIRRPLTVGASLIALAGIGLTAWVQWQVAQSDWQASASHSWRNFYGVISLREQDEDDPLLHRLTLAHGRIDHGSQLQAEARRLWATDYYSVGSGLGHTIHWLRERRPGALRVGIVGLGAGTIAAYGRTGDDFRFYELNPLVERVARQHFSYLELSPATTAVVLGDARLSLTRQSPANFDLLVLDAFNSDAVPLHLLTWEAFQAYEQQLAAQGIVAVHVSNLHLDLSPMIAATAGASGWHALELDYDGGEEAYVSGSTWVVLSREAEALQALARQADALWLRRDLSGGPVMTDRFSNLFDLLRD